MTLAQWRAATVAALTEDSAAVAYLDEKIAAAPEQGAQEVLPRPYECVRLMLLQIHMDGIEKPGSKPNPRTPPEMRHDGN